MQGNMSRRVLILFAHPMPRKSRVNRVLASNVRNLDGVTFHDLYEAYPDFDIDVEREKALLGEHDAIVFQHPFYWYSAPALVKEWLDLVLEYGWAYGEKGTALKGKLWQQAITTGGPADAYQSSGYNRFSIRQLLAPFEQTANLCSMAFQEPFVIHGVLPLSRSQIEAEALRYRALIEQLRQPEAAPHAP
jgi:glutathione-regulated potassium-efflux system ancillary protein KefG